MNPMVTHEAQANSTKGNSFGSVASPFGKGQFQDGGQNVMFGYKAREEGVNSHGLGKSSQYNSHNLPPDSVSGQSDTTTSMNDSMQSSSMANYNGNFSRNSYGMNEQHGGLTNTSTADFPSQNSQYNQYGQSSMRPGYPPGPRGSPGPNRTGMPQPGMNMMGSNYANNQQRFPMSGPTIQQQGGPTPTLNQLLQNPNAAQRYQAAGYGYDNSMSKGNGDMTGGNPSSFSQGWTGQQRPPMNPYQQQQMQPGFRSQQGQMYNHGSVGSPLQTGGNFNHQYPYTPGNGQQRFPHPRPHPNSSSQPYNNSSQNDSQSSERQSSSTPTENGDHEPPSSSSSSQPQPQENSVSSNGGEDSNSNPAICENGNGNSPSHPSVQALKPSPSPGPGSQQGSRSNTPASLTGQQSSSPMPPTRPPSNQSPLSNNSQGGAPYNNQQQPPQHPGGPMMPPPPSGSSQAPPPQQYNNKPPYSHYPGAANMQQQAGYRYPSQANNYPGMYPNSSMAGVPRPAGYPPYPGGPMFYNDQQQSVASPSSKGGAVQAAQAVVAAAESQSKGTASPRPMEMMNGPRSGPAPLNNHTPMEGQGPPTAIVKQEDTNSIKSSASATPQPPSPQSSQDSLTNQTMPDDDDDEQKPDIKQESLSHPSTPAPAASPSLSSIQEDSSSSWPGTPASQQQQQQSGASSSSAATSGTGAKFGNQDVFARLCEMGEEADRKQWLEGLFTLMEEKGTPINVLPAISKNAVDLFRLYHLTKERGGLVEVTKQKKWRDISTALNIGSSSSAGFTLKKNYCKYIFPYECKYDNNNADPAPILAQIEAAQKKDSRKSSSGSSSNSGGAMMGGPMMPPNVNMMPNAGTAQPGGPMYDQQGMMGMQQDYGNGGNGQYPGGPGRMANHYNPAAGPPSSSAANQPPYDNRVYDQSQQRGYGGPPGGRPNEQYSNYPPQQGGYYPGYQGQKPAQGMYPGHKGPYPNSPYPAGPPSGSSSSQYGDAGSSAAGYMAPRRDQWPAGDRQRSGGGFGGPNVSSTGPTSSPSPTPPLYKQQQQQQQQRMSPQRTTDSGTSGKPNPYAQSKMSQQKSGSSFAMKKDIVFPPDSVEATEPRLTKRKRLTHRDLEKVDPWRLLMSLRSGQLAEATWALDTLSILLFDDHTVHYFGLSHMPGLLETLIEHLRRCLIEMFGAPFADQEVLPAVVGAEENGSFLAALSEADPPPPQEDDDVATSPFSTAANWDKSTGVKSSSSDWQLGRGDTTLHVITHMESEKANSFYRRKFLKRKAATSVDACKAASEADAKKDDEEDRSDSGVKMEEYVISEEEEEEEEVQDTTVSSLLNDSGADVKDLISSIECNELDKKFLERLKRKLEKGDEESESYEHDTPPLCLLTDCQEELARRCICISNILRNLSFIPGNDREMARHNGLLSVVGQLLLLHHWHPKRRRVSGPMAAAAAAAAAGGREDSNAPTAADIEEDSCTAGQGGGNVEEWWWETLDTLRENILVLLSNIAGHLNLSVFSEEICMPVLNGLLHWSVCPSACAQDPLASMPPNSILSSQRLVLEALCKLCVTDTNVDLLLATPPFSRIVQLFTCLVRQLAERNDQVLREFSIVLLSSLVAGDSSAARAVALQHPAISLLIDFIESAEQSAAHIVNAQGQGGLRMIHDNPELIGTSLDMLRRAATALKHLAAVPENRSLFLPQQNRLLALVMSHTLDQNVTKQLASVLFLGSTPPTDCTDEAENMS